tara:strand:- start:186 stop:989 length:804 start_codon:yes stop_codon:yes gene_type:complete
MKTPDILKKIVKRKIEYLNKQKIEKPISILKNSIDYIENPRGFIESLKKDIKDNKAGVIAELKKASPSKGILRENFDPISIAQSFSKNGASCLSVLTEEDFFLGSNSNLIKAKQSCNIPVLRKDFIIDSYQILESKVIGADCILLIVACLEKDKLHSLCRLAHELEMDVLIEVHDQEELDIALEVPNNFIGINNRNLNTFEVNLDTTLNLFSKIPKEYLVVTESGINSINDVSKMRDNGINSFLVGESLMSARNPGAKLHELFFDEA